MGSFVQTVQPMPIIPRPVIGIVQKHYINGSKFPEGNQFSYSSDDLAFAVGDNGGIPICITSPSRTIKYADNDSKIDSISEEEREILIEAIKLCNGIILQGGVESDIYEIFIAQYCYENNIPILGICAGQNNMIRAVGGKSKPVEDKEKHNLEFDKLVHRINILPNTLMSKMFKLTGELRVNSIHTNVIDPDSIGETDLIISAYDEFGNPECIECKDENKIYITMRFHPEALTNNKEVGNIMSGFFEQFVRMCKFQRREITHNDRQ